MRNFIQIFLISISFIFITFSLEMIIIQTAFADDAFVVSKTQHAKVTETPSSQDNINRGLAEIEKRKEDYKKEVLLELAKK